MAATLTDGFSVSAPQPTITSLSPTPVTFGSWRNDHGREFDLTTVTGSTATATVRFVYVTSGILIWWPSTALPAGSTP
jgi:hypothetical protein